MTAKSSDRGSFFIIIINVYSLHLMTNWRCHDPFSEIGRQKPDNTEIEGVGVLVIWVRL